ncbi:ShlB/FhaC/HecB family hemolysin secretion/activation protein [Myxosarcina sp. GI1]|uniref:ShlB/FhaC/HecB family hemolysin secretion/activation protein n=1 Tax=Myxosarcina sp. GI1 TaxID=1541065 RepID=UPI00068ED802|nr:ShlB/FhaC/HecB family hemolysin secretion/activation protein [Myxosarcina sp. GI1]
MWQSDAMVHLGLKHWKLFGYGNLAAILSFALSLPTILVVQPANAETINTLTAEREQLSNNSVRSADSNILNITAPKTKPNDNSVAAASDDNIPESIVVKSFDIVGSTVFSQEELASAVASYQNRSLTLSELYQARSEITKLYTEEGYVNSGAYIPPQELDDGKVTIAVLEGELEAIEVRGTERLDPDYVRSRLETAADKPVNVESLLEALQLLRLDPLIASVSAELSAGVRQGTSLLDVKIEEADNFNVTTSFDNGRSPSVGTNRRAVGLNHRNLLGFGDEFSFGYANTEGSDSFDFAYSFPFNALDGTVGLAYGFNFNEVIEDPFNALDIESESRYYELSLRQPIINRPNRELALGISFTRQESETLLLNTPFALSRGADENGETRISTIRLFQEFIERDDKKVLAFRSSFNIGIDAFDATSNADAPDSIFFAWRGQSQWVRQLERDFVFLLRGDLQLATTGLVPLEQFRLGGFNSVRGYRQDLILGDNGLFASAELRIPVLRLGRTNGVIQLAPFFDLGTAWSSDDMAIDDDFISAVGIGLVFRAGENFNARLDWGIPLVDIDTDSNSLQEDGIYFSIDYNFF